MSVVAGIQNSNIKGVKGAPSQTVPTKLQTATEAVQSAAKTVLDLATRPLGVIFVTQTALHAYMFNASIVKSALATTLSLTLAGVASDAVDRCKARWLEPKPSLVIPVTEKNFKTEVLESKIPVMMLAYKNSVTHDLNCAAFQTFFETHKEMKSVKFVYMNVEKEPTLAKELDIQTTPALLSFKNGKPVNMIEWRIPCNTI